jgi:hypothetical protein
MDMFYAPEFCRFVSPEPPARRGWNPCAAGDFSCGEKCDKINKFQP